MNSKQPNHDEEYDKAEEKIQEVKSGIQFRIPLMTGMNCLVTISTMTNNPDSKIISMAMIALTVLMWVLLLSLVVYYISLCTKHKRKVIELTTKS